MQSLLGMYINIQTNLVKLKAHLDDCIKMSRLEELTHQC